MDLSNKRFRDLKELIKTRNEFNNWIRENQEEVLDDVNILDESDEIYSKLIPITVNFIFTRPIDKTIKPIYIVIEKYSHRFTGISINNTSFFFYNVNNQNIIHHEKNKEHYYLLTDGLKMLLEGRGLLKFASSVITQQDIKNYFSILHLANVQTNDVKYLNILANGGMGKGKDGKGIDFEDDENEEENPLELMVELRKLLAAKMAGHNNVYNSIVSILNKLLNLNQISKERYNKILKKYF